MTEIPRHLCFVQGSINGDGNPNHHIGSCLNRVKPNNSGSTTDMTITHPNTGIPVVLFQCRGKESSKSKSVPNAQCFCGMRTYDLTPADIAASVDLPRYYVMDDPSTQSATT